MEALRGLPEAKLVVSVPGGELDGMTMRVPGVTRFAVGEEAVVFAYQAPNGFLRVRGLSQGKFAVGLDSQGVKTVGSSLESLRLLRPVSSAKQPPPQAAASPPGTLDGLLHRVRALVAEELR